MPPPMTTTSACVGRSGELATATSGAGMRKVSFDTDSLYPGLSPQFTIDESDIKLTLKATSADLAFSPAVSTDAGSPAEAAPNLFFRMNLPSLLLAIPLLTATVAMAQVGPRTDRAQCASEEGLLMEEIDTARARGRMLQRRQLTDQLEALQVRCGLLPPAQSREAAIGRLQGEILDLRRELDRAETELRKLRQGL